MKHKYIFITLFIVPFISFGQDTIIRTGRYTKKDIYAQNSMVVKGNDTLWSAQQVIVNDRLILCGRELWTSAFIIPLTKMQFNKGDTITLKIIQTNSIGPVKILNP